MATRAGRNCNYLVINKNLICFTSASNILIVNRQPNKVLFIFVPSERPYLKEQCCYNKKAIQILIIDMLFQASHALLNQARLLYR